MSADSADAFGNSIGRAMADDRPLPQYGEYATPEQQAAAMGKHYVGKHDVGEHDVGEHDVGQHDVAPGAPPTPQTRVNLAPPGAAGQRPHGERAGVAGNAADRFATIFQLGIGFVFLLNSDYFHFAANFNSVSSQLGLAQRVPASLDQLGWLLLTANILFLAATMLWAYTRIRRDKLTFWVPVVGYVAFSLLVGVLLYASV
jgi:hypothetical protein